MKLLSIPATTAAIGVAMVCFTVTAAAQSTTDSDCSSSVAVTRFTTPPEIGISFLYPSNWTFDAQRALLGPPGRVKRRANGSGEWVVCAVSLGIHDLDGASPGAAIRARQAEFLKGNTHLRQLADPEVILRNGAAIVLTRFGHGANATGDERELVLWASVFTAYQALDPDYILPLSRATPSRVYELVLTGPALAFPALEQRFHQLLSSLTLPSLTTNLQPPAPAGGTRQPSGGIVGSLVGVWTGLRPTNGYVWEFRFTMELKPNGTYSYSLLQAGSRPAWKLSMTGRWSATRTGSATWPLQLELVPDRGSQGPPTEQDRLALFDDLGLPDDRPHSFRVRPSSIGGFTVQPVEANPNDQISQTWSLSTR